MDTVPADTAAPPPDGFLPLPEAGRVFTGGCRIRRTDVTPGGRLRLDALTRYLQDVAKDDIAEAGLREPYDWLVRRIAITVRGYPQRGQRLRLTTFCSATGPRWAERTTTLSASGTEFIQARARLACRRTSGRADIWLLNDTTRLASARLSRDPGEPGTGGALAAGSGG